LEARALRQAKRLSQRDFAAEVCVGERLIAKWEKGGENIIPRPINQQVLDSLLASASAEVQVRFAEMIGQTSPATAAQHPDENSEQPADPELGSPLPTGDEDEVRRPIDGKLMTQAPPGGYLAGGNNDPISLPVHQVETLRQELHEALSEGMMAEAGLDDWERLVLRYGRATRGHPASVLLDDLSTDLTELKWTIQRHRSASAMRRLTRVAAHMSGLMCLTLCKLDDHSAFRRWTRTVRTQGAFPRSLGESDRVPVTC
jgi:transcriptional regulator with XRE-family HTH domain